VLPISVLVPTRNSMPLLPKHVEGMRLWLDLAEEVVVVDSHSQDGTREFLERELKHPGLRVLDHPPGLYQSWNFGLAQCRAKYIYISTIGDTITREGLEHLVKAAEGFACDVVISPPQMVREGAAVDRRWPVHELIESRKLQRPVAFSPFETFVFAFVNLRKAILGSSASNLYRGEVLRRAPFPTDFGTAGDLGWILQHAAEIRLGVIPETFSTFLFHPKVYAKSDYAVNDFAEKCLATARETLARAASNPGWGSAPGVVALRELDIAWGEYLQAKRRFKTSRAGRALWMLSPTNWRAYRAREEKLRRLRIAQTIAMQNVIGGDEASFKNVQPRMDTDGHG
jgi:glycosyltransferase involved in cell wall biosynthesis